MQGWMSDEKAVAADISSGFIYFDTMINLYSPRDRHDGSLPSGYQAKQHPSIPKQRWKDLEIL
jgi:hypothetical protein